MTKQRRRAYHPKRQYIITAQPQVIADLQKAAQLHNTTEQDMAAKCLALGAAMAVSLPPRNEAVAVAEAAQPSGE